MESADNAGGFGVLEVSPEAKLRAIIEITRSLAGTVDFQAIVPLILDTLFSIFPQADRGCILLKDAETAQMVPARRKHRRPDARRDGQAQPHDLEQGASKTNRHPLGRRDQRRAVSRPATRSRASRSAR